LPKTETKAQEGGTVIEGGVKDDGTGYAIYTDKYDYVSDSKGVLNRFADDITYDQRGTHRYEKSFGAVIETQNLLNESSVSSSGNNNFTIINGINDGGLQPTFGEVSQQLASPSEPPTQGSMSDASSAMGGAPSVMGYDTNGGQTAYSTNLSSTGDLSALDYIFTSQEASVLLSNAGGSNALGDLAGDMSSTADDSFDAVFNALASLGSNLATGSGSVGTLLKVEALQSGFDRALEELKRKIDE